jgi:hypothetical protein
MKKLFLITLIFCFSIALSAQNPALLKLKYEQNYTVTYNEAIDMFRLLDEHYKNAVLLEKGLTDCGKPLHLFVMNSEPEFNPEKIRQQGKTILLINNGIHAGEPEGIDASLEFADDVLRNKDGMAKLLEKTVIVIIPVYNIGGVLNRSAYNRSGQTTPYETGFRGNYANLDLNRDFTKCDSENGIPMFFLILILPMAATISTASLIYSLRRHFIRQEWKNTFVTNWFHRFTVV